MREAVRRRRVMDRFAAELTRRAARKALDAWSYARAERRRGRALAKRLVRKRAAAAFFTWRDATDAALDVSEAEAAEDSRRDGALRRAVSRFARRDVAAAFAAWTAATRRDARIRWLVARALGRLASRATSAAFHAWTGFKQTRRETRVLLRRCAGKIMHRTLSGAFDRMREAAGASRSLRSRHARLVMRLRGGVASRAFRRWTERVREKVTVTRRMRNIVKRIAIGVARQSWNTWVDAVEERRWTRSVLVRALARFSSRHLAASFDAWLGNGRDALHLTSSHRTLPYFALFHFTRRANQCLHSSADPRHARRQSSADLCVPPLLVFTSARIYNPTSMLS